MTFSVREVSLGEVCEIKQGRYLAPNQMEPSPTNECFVPVIGGNGVLGYTDQSTFPFPVPLVTCRGSKCGLMQWAEPPTWISNNAMAVYFKENQGDNFFLHQYLLNSSFDDVTTGSAQPQITVTNLSLKQILLPNLQTQKTISLLMKNIEGKIAINNVLSNTLEDIAQTIFESWFIDFDPVKAKMAGEKPAGMDAATAALFPDSMEESELGLIPKTWKIRTIGDSVTRQRVGKLFDAKTTSSEGSVPVLDQGKFGFIGFHNEEPGVFASPDKPIVVFSNHSCLLRIISYPFSVIQNVFPLLGNDVDQIWLFFAIRGKQYYESYKGHWPDFIHHAIIRPPMSLTVKFRVVVEPLMKEIWRLEKESRLLTELRDLLLPRLISGELQIPDEMLAT
jgi:type I restriction enzyme S subunit